MATLDSDDANILDAETINWRLIVYPILAALIVVVGALGYYFYLQSQRENLEDTARTALLNAKTPEDMVKVADQFPHTDQATLALLAAANGSFGKRDYAAAIQDYQRIISTAGTDPGLRDSAQLGLASSLEANGKIEDAAAAYLEAGRMGAKSPYAAFAYTAAASLYNQRGDKDEERKALTEAASLESDLPSVKEAQYKLKALAAAHSLATETIPVGNAPGPPATNAPVKP
jgi:predicted negative regulator of RcsB-dependent stress response